MPLTPLEEQSQVTVFELGKSQFVRQVDFLVLGPFLIWAGLQTRPPKWVKTVLVVAGIGTIVYNYSNYRENL